MKNVLLAVAVALLPLQVFAQYKLSGRVSDVATGQALAGANVVLDGRNSVSAGQNGYYEFSSVPAGSYTLRVSYLGYGPVQQQIDINQDMQQDITLQQQALQTGEVVVSATRANAKTGTTFTNVSREELEERNFGQDLPYLLDQTPSVVVNSDAGAGVGYTGIRIRGSDITRINVTVNGIPINDSESHGVFFVNMPDFASSVQDIQVQRGVGTSTNGAGAFGASINIRTQQIRREAYAEISNSYGSFDTWKHTVSFGSGLLKDKFTFDGRLSKVSSDGYIDYASSDLKSYYFAAGYYGKTGMLKFISFSGIENTHQAWDGVPEDKLETDRTYNGLSYENEIDHYQQDHYQLHYSKDLLPRLNLGGAFHLTRGRGYYEQYKDDQKLASYTISPVVLGDTLISRSDLIRRKWLDNYFYGATYALNYFTENGKLNATIGGAWNKYDGDHYGEVIWTRFASDSEIRQRYYFNNAVKTDFNIFGKVNYQLTDRLGVFGDMQYRSINYEIDGLDDDKRDVTQQADFQFFNPKAGVTYEINGSNSVYASYAVGHREPTRSDFTDSPRSNTADVARPNAETMYNLEAGYRLRGTSQNLLGQSARYTLDANYYYMDYDNQLVLTGQLNDVGTPLRTNIKNSYRTGIELAGMLNLDDVVELRSTLTLSRNKIRNYSETVYVYDADYNVENTIENMYNETDISFSPAVISSHSLEVQPLKGLKAALLYKTVSKQYLDNTASDARKINGYQVADLRLRYTLQPPFMKELEVALLVNNLFNQKYEANGYTFSEEYSGDATRYDYNYYYPQATRNFLLSVGLKF
ncbi:TonB-dependent receptor [Pontibacter sp. 172403-2]|uniref:TonB-dependent receptor n=1 Tax=Pontibacter rufus TaxID=2791028 RepID=UPI0018B013A7|nr:TonB-dependent receptor [Pontibacter sp. 172403-2]MBF9253307.1 TonB-dependent receptor [Pontibacter sp. 172403-2]